jgi:biotin carboxyl carrier protein
VKYCAESGGREERATVERRADGRFEVTVRGKTYVADLRRIAGSPVFSLLLGARTCELSAAREHGAWRIDLCGSSFVVRVETEQERTAREIDSGRDRQRAAEVRASMPGFVTRVLVATGDEVSKGTPLMIIEAMKMENEIRAEHAGVIAEIAVAERQTVNNGDVLLRIS